MCFSLNRILVEKENICGHKITAECGRNLSTLPCASKCWIAATSVHSFAKNRARPKPANVKLN